MKFVEIMYDIFWIIGAVFFYGISLIPCFFLVRWGFLIPFPYFLFVLPVAFFLFLISLMLITGFFRLFIPNLKEGKYNFPNDRQVSFWIANRWITQYLLIPFDRIIFLIPILRYLCLRLYGVRLYYSSEITSNIISDLSMLKFGKSTTIGAFAHIYGHIQPATDTILLGITEIGDNTMIGANTSILCGSKVGNRVIIGIYCFIGYKCKIGDNCRVGYNTKVGNRCILEDDVIVGKHCILGNRINIKKGIRIPDFSRVPDEVVIESQDMIDNILQNNTNKPFEYKSNLK